MYENKIIIQHLNKFYGKKQVLYDLNLTIKQGMFGLLGRNGAGKTTLMKTVATLLNKKSGNITVCGIPVENAKEVRQIIGFLPQEFSMYPNMTVMEALDYLGVLSGIDKKERKKRIPILLEKVNLIKQRKKKVKALSGGMKRRLGIAQALLHDPRVVIVDEPTVGLDPEERVRFRNLLCEIAEDKIVILSTHIVGDIEATCDNIAILNDGKIVFDGTVSALINTARNKVFSMIVQKEELANIKARYIVTGVLTTNHGINVRVVTDEKPYLNAEFCEPNVEDAYMFCLYKNGIQKHGFGGGR